MTIQNELNRWSYIGNGVTTIYPFTNRIFEATDLRVYFDGVLQNTGYSVTGVNDALGGSVTFAVPPAAAIEVEILRKVPANQKSKYRALGPFPAEIAEMNLDKLTVLAQQLEAADKRTIRLQDGESFDGDLELPLKADRANRTLGFDSDGNVSASVPLNPGALNATAIGEALLGTATQATGRSVLGAASEASLNAVRAYLAAANPIGTIAPMLRWGAPDGWLELNGFTIGNAASGATAASNLYHDFFVYSWNTLLDAPVTPGVRGLTAELDWAANKRLEFPDLRGRTIIGAGAGTGLTLRMLGAVLGEESHLLTSTESGLPAHSHEGNFIGITGGGDPAKPYAAEATADVAPTGLPGLRYTRQSSAASAAQPHNNMQPSFVARWMVWTGVYPNAQPLNLADLGFEWLGVWNSATAYDVGDVVRHDASGATYIATAPSTNSTPNRTGFVSLNANWALVSVDGVAGNNGVFVWKGTWSGAAIYAIGDVVTLAGSCYRCITAHNNHTPPNVLYWEPLALKGDTGPQGIPGLLTAIEQDSAPKLGGNLLINGKKIISVPDQDIELAPGGNGQFKAKGLIYPGVDGLPGEYLSTDGAGKMGWKPIPTIGLFRGLKIRNNVASPNNKMDITVEALIVTNSLGGDPILLTNVSATVDITVSGKNGLDVGSEAPSTWYPIFIEYNKTSPAEVAGLLSLSATAPALSAGFTHKAFVGWIRNDGSGNFVRSYQVNRLVNVGQQLIFTNQAGPAAWTAASISNAVPPGATIVEGNGGLSTQNAHSMGVACDVSGTGAKIIAAYNCSGAIFDTWAVSMGFKLIMGVPQQIAWRAASTNPYYKLEVTAYEF